MLTKERDPVSDKSCKLTEQARRQGEERKERKEKEGRNEEMLKTN